MNLTRLVPLTCLVGVIVALVAKLSMAQDAAPNQNADVAFVAAFERLARQERVDEVAAGRLLISELNCTSCHPSTSPMLSPKSGPSLSAAGLRLKPDWVHEFLLNPSHVHAGTTMPNAILESDERERHRVARDITTFLMLQKQPFPIVKASGAVPVPFEFWNRGRPEVGQTLYHTIGCVACHEPRETKKTTTGIRSPSLTLLETLDVDDLEEFGLSDQARPVPSIPHPNLAAKYTRKGLTFFLLKPEAVRTGGRMPDFNLTPTEAADLAAYLLSQDSVPASTQPPTGVGDPESGQAAMTRFRCFACHETNGSQPDASTLPRLHQLPTDQPAGCLQPEHANGPSFNLDDQQREAILTALRQQNPEKSHTTAQKLQHRLLSSNCIACHERDGIGGIGFQRRKYLRTVDDVDLGDEGRLPPPLTGAGKKIKPSWFARVLAGKKADVRPHLTVRMPKFPGSTVERLPAWFATIDGRAADLDSDVTDARIPNSDLVDAGRRLMDLGCVQCHPFNGFAMPGVVGVDLANINDRVHQEWFAAFLRDPAKLKKGTRMPTFFAGGVAQDQEILGGNPTMQIAAMWEYLSSVNADLLPQKIQESRSQSYELVPESRPILLRTFMPDVGTHAIAVGNPQGVHFAFDAERVRLAVAWRGRFIDAQGTWFVRFAPPADPLGDEAISFPNGNVFAPVDRPPDPNGHRFGGYRLDDQGVPTFLYQYLGLKIEDRIVAQSDGSLRRTWKLTPSVGAEAAQHDTIEFTPLSGSRLKALGDDRFAGVNTPTVVVNGLPQDAAKIVDAIGSPQSGQQRLVYLIDVSRPTSIQVDYQW